MNKKLLFIPLLALVGGLVVGCVPTQTNTSDSSESNTTDTSTLPEWVDYVHNGSVTLQIDYQGKDFYKDGIGEMNLHMCIDGDTAHFKPVNTSTSSENVKARFYGIDTPESTGKVQMWGKEASLFTQEKLENAAANGTIVVSTYYDSYGAPIPDSTGERYVSLVWINEEKKNAPYDELVLLNLWIVQEGLSWVKNVLEVPAYADTFYAAENQARAYKLCLFSDEIPPHWPTGEYEMTSLLDLKRETVKLLTDPTYESVFDNKKVIIQGTVAGFANHILYLQDYFSEDVSGTPGGEYAGINIFVGMSPIPSKYTTKNTYLEIHGLAQYSENFGFQITDTEGRYPIVANDSVETNTKILFTAEENVDEHKLYEFQYTASELSKVVSEQNYESLYCAVRVTDAITIRDAYVASSNEITLYVENCEFQIYLTFMYRGDPNSPSWYWTKPEEFIGQSFYLNGIYTYHKTSSGKIVYQVNPITNNDLVWTGASA